MVNRILYSRYNIAKNVIVLVQIQKGPNVDWLINTWLASCLIIRYEFNSLSYTIKKLMSRRDRPNWTWPFHIFDDIGPNMSFLARLISDNSWSLENMSLEHRSFSHPKKKILHGSDRTRSHQQFIHFSKVPCSKFNSCMHSSSLQPFSRHWWCDGMIAERADKTIANPTRWCVTLYCIRRHIWLQFLRMFYLGVIWFH